MTHSKFAKPPPTPEEAARIKAAWNQMTCKDLVHPNVDTCRGFWTSVWINAFRQGLGIYSPIFIIPALIARKNPKYLITRLPQDIVRAATFLAFYCGGLTYFYCMQTRLPGPPRLKYAWIAGFLAGGALFIERKGRRAELGLYAANHATEAIFRMLESRGYVRFLPYGDVGIFSSAMAILYYYYRREPNSVARVIKALFGFLLNERPPKGEQQLSAPEEALKAERHVERELRDTSLSKEAYSEEMRGAFQGSIRAFRIGCGIRASVALLKGLMKGLWRQPTKLLGDVAGKNTLFFGLFLAGFTGGVRGVESTLKYKRQKDDGLNSLVAGAVGGSAVVFSRSSELAMYCLFKAIEVVHRSLIQKGYPLSLPHGDVLLFSWGVGTLMHTALHEPHNLRPSYWHFIQRITVGRFGECNRKAFEWTGWDNDRISRMYPPYKRK